MCDGKRKKMMRAAPPVRVKARVVTVKNAVILARKTLIYGVFGREFGFRSHEWSCSHSIKARK